MSAKGKKSADMQDLYRRLLDVLVEEHKDRVYRGLVFVPIGEKCPICELILRAQEALA